MSNKTSFKEFIISHRFILLLMILNAIYFDLILKKGFGYNTLINFGAIDNNVIINNQWWRVISYGFMHSSYQHYINNMLMGLGFLGFWLEDHIGSFKVLLIYMYSLIIAGLCIVYLGSSLTLGSSGGIAGLLGSLFYLSIRKYSKFKLSERIFIWFLIIINGLYTVLSTNISLEGHLGGFIAGFILSVVLLAKNDCRAYYTLLNKKKVKLK